MIVVFLLSGIVYYIMLSRVLIHELDESLYDYKDGITRYMTQQNKLPQVLGYDETEISFAITSFSTAKEELSSVITAGTASA